MNSSEIHSVCREELVLREFGFQLVRSKDGRFVATETPVYKVPATLPHATAEDAWQATYQRVVCAN